MEAQQEGELLDVGEVVEEEHLPGAEEGHGEELLVEAALILSFVALIALAWRPAKRAILGSLDARAARIRAALDEARRLRDEAQTALADIQRRQRDAAAEARAIVEHARQEAERLQSRAAADLEESLQRREAAAMTRIGQAEAAALAEVRALAADVAVAAARQLIAEEMGRPQASGALVDAAIRDLPRRLH